MLLGLSVFASPVSHYNYILHDSLNPMLGKTSVSMMVLFIVVASLIGISSIHQYVEGQKPYKRAVGNVLQFTSYTAVAGCVTPVVLASNVPNDLGLKPGTSILLFSERESGCVILGMSKMSGYGAVAFEAQKMTVSSLPPVVRADLELPANYPTLYRMFSVDIS